MQTEIRLTKTWKRSDKCWTGVRAVYEASQCNICPKCRSFTSRVIDYLGQFMWDCQCGHSWNWAEKQELKTE